MRFVFGLIAGMFVASLALVLLRWPVRALANRWFDAFVHRLTVEPYAKNLWEFASAAGRTGPHLLQENSLRAHAGKVIQRPLESTKRFPDFTGLMFSPAQLHTLPTPLATPVDMKVTIGKQAGRPLSVDIPILIAPMSYGGALSEGAKVALARGASLAGTASNTGEGPMLLAERAAAAKLIHQYGRGSWGKDEDVLRQADAIEIQFGQGAWAGVGHVMPASRIGEKLRRTLGLYPGQDAVIESRQPGVKGTGDLKELVDYLRRVSHGVPIGAKLAASHTLERDLDCLIDAGVDYVSLDGAQAAAQSSPPILADDFGLPTVAAVCRAARHLQHRNVKERVSLIMSGGIATPGDMLKALALGADAVYIGTTAIQAISHLQILHALPWEPPTQIVWYGGSLGHKFDPEKGAVYLARYLKACRDELEHGVRGVGKTSIAQVGLPDLSALDPETAAIAGVPLGYETVS